MVDEKQEIIENELSTGLVIVGAYANKLRRTLFAQLRDLVKQNREFAREVARASAEINRLIYIILVENLGCEKGDVVRIRVKYTVDLKEWRIKWNYETLRIEYFKRQPDDKVAEVVKKVISEKLEEIKEQYKEAPTREEAEAILKGEVKTPEEEWDEEKEKTIEFMGATQPIKAEEAEQTPMEALEEIASADPIGETMIGGAVFKLTNKNGESVGIASLEPHAGGWIIDVIIISKGKAYRARIKASKNKEEYMNNPGLIIEEIKKTKPVPISREDAETIIRSKMEELV